MPAQKRNLLVVEDDPGLQSQLRWCFEDYEVSVAEDRESALAQLRRYEPGVVLQDLGLPPDAEGVSEGLATLEETLSLAPNTKVIVPTYNDPNDAIALQALQGLYPNRTVVGIDFRNAYANGGMTHCVTQQQPAE